MNNKIFWYTERLFEMYNGASTSKRLARFFLGDPYRKHNTFKYCFFTPRYIEVAKNYSM